MKIREIAALLEAEVLCCEDRLDNEVYSACGSDMMSDVLAFVKDQSVLLTGLVNIASQSRNQQGGQNSQNDQNNDQFDEGEALFVLQFLEHLVSSKNFL